MHSNSPAAITFSFEGFSARGGHTDEHKDGWGIAFYGDSGCQLFKDYLSSVASPIAELVKRNPLKSKNIIAHIRKATQGPVAMDNTHPFMRTLWGQQWTFAHNGDLKNFTPALYGQFQPVGQTDSERAFCYLMNVLHRRFSTSLCAPPLAELFEAVNDVAREIEQYGIFNFILSNGDALFAHCSTNLHYVERAYPFSTAQLIDCDVTIDFSHYNHRDDRMIVIATKPLTSNERWVAFHSGELKMFIDGHIGMQALRRLPPTPLPADTPLLTPV